MVILATYIENQWISYVFVFAYSLWLYNLIGNLSLIMLIYQNKKKLSSIDHVLNTEFSRKMIQCWIRFFLIMINYDIYVSIKHKVKESD